MRIESDGHSQGNPRLYELIEHAPKTGKSPTVWAWPELIDYLKIAGQPVPGPWPPHQEPRPDPEEDSLPVAVADFDPVAVASPGPAAVTESVTVTETESVTETDSEPVGLTDPETAETGYESAEAGYETATWPGYESATERPPITRHAESSLGDDPYHHRH